MRINKNLLTQLLHFDYSVEVKQAQRSQFVLSHWKQGRRQYIG